MNFLDLYQFTGICFALFCIGMSMTLIVKYTIEYLNDNVREDKQISIMGCTLFGDVTPDDEWAFVVAFNVLCWFTFSMLMVLFWPVLVFAGISKIIENKKLRSKQRKK